MNPNKKMNRRNRKKRMMNTTEKSHRFHHKPHNS